MSIADFATYKSRRDNPWFRFTFDKTTITTTAGYLFSAWKGATGVPLVGATPTTSGVRTSADVGSFGQPDGTNARILNTQVAVSGNAAGNAAGGTVIIADRLVDHGGMDATVTGVQTTNIGTWPTLTRYTNGVGVMMALEIYTAIGATGTTVTASYTNDVGTAGQISVATSFGAVNFNTAGRAIVLPIVASDRGVKAVANANVLATTGTAGNFGFTLFYPLMTIGVLDLARVMTYDGMLDANTWFPIVQTGACLQFLYHSGNGVVFSPMNGEISISED